MQDQVQSRVVLSQVYQRSSYLRCLIVFPSKSSIIALDIDLTVPNQ